MLRRYHSMKYIIFLLLVANTLFSQCKDDNTWNHHIHLFSPSLLEDLRKEPSGSEFLKDEDPLYSDIDTIMSKVRCDKIVLISTGYGFRKEGKSGAQLNKLVEEENDFLFKSYGKYPDRIFPFIGIDPLEDFSLNEVKRCRKMFRYFGIKLHFHSSKIDLLNPDTLDQLKPIFEYARMESIPLLIHFKNHQQDFGKEHIASFFENLMNSHEALTIIFAHTGGDGLINEKTKAIVKEIIQQNKRYQQNVFFEISTAIWYSYMEKYEIEDSEKTKLLKEIGLEHILYGTDYPARDFIYFGKQLKQRLDFTDEEYNRIQTNSPLDKYVH